MTNSNINQYDLRRANQSAENLGQDSSPSELYLCCPIAFAKSRWKMSSRFCLTDLARGETQGRCGIRVNFMRKCKVSYWLNFPLGGGLVIQLATISHQHCTGTN